MITTYLLNSSKLPDPLQNEKLLIELPKERVEKIHRLKQAESRKQSYGAGLLLAYGLQQVIPINEENLHKQIPKLHYNTYGKPLITGIPFNLSHTENYVILSIYNPHIPTNQPCPDTLAVPPKEIRIGCDIEKIKKYNPKIAKRFFTSSEYQNLESTTDQQSQAELFTRNWTRKESVLKLTGLGIALPMDLFDVSSEIEATVIDDKFQQWYQSSKSHNHPELEQAAKILKNNCLYFKEYRYNDYIITVCSNYNHFESNILYN